MENKKDEKDQIISECVNELIEEIEVPPAEAMWTKIQQRMKEEKDEKITIKISTKVLKYAAASITVLIFTSIIFSSSWVEAFKIKVLNTIIEIKDNTIELTYSTNEKKNEEIENNQIQINNTEDTEVTLEQLKNKLPFNLLVFNYLPQGMSLNNVKIENQSENNIRVLINYMKDKRYINFIQEHVSKGFSEGKSINVKDGDVEKINILNQKGTLVKFKNNTYKVFWNTENLRYDIYTNIEYNELLKVLNSITELK